MKRIFILILSLSLLLISFAYADSTSNNEIVEEGSHVLSIYTLNYRNPISVTQNEEDVTISIFNKLFESVSYTHLTLPTILRV